MYDGNDINHYSSILIGIFVALKSQKMNGRSKKM